MPSIAKKIVIAIMQNNWMPDPITAANIRLLLGGLKTSPWTSFHPVSSMLSSRSSSVLYFAMSLQEVRNELFNKRQKTNNMKKKLNMNSFLNKLTFEVYE